MSGILQIGVEEAKKLKNFLIEEKVDGGCVYYNKGVLLSDKRWINQNHKFPHILKELKNLNGFFIGEIAIPWGNVLLLNKKINWGRTKYYIFDILEFEGKNFREADVMTKRMKIEEIIKGFKHLSYPKRFKTFEEGWNFVLKNNTEGLVLKDMNSKVMYKCKRLIEEKLPIITHIKGKSKGAFLLSRNGIKVKCSANSIKLVEFFNYLKFLNKKPYAEIEYCFLTPDKKPFQPRLRRIIPYEDLLKEGATNIFKN